MYRRLGGPQGWSGQVRKISPPTGIRSPDLPTRSQSLYRLRYPAHNRVAEDNKKRARLVFVFKRLHTNLGTRVKKCPKFHFLCFYAIRSFCGFLRRAQYVSFSTKCRLFHILIFLCSYSICSYSTDSLLSSVALVRERTIPTERPPPVGEVSANFCG